MKNISKQCRIGFLSTFIWGLVAHGVMMTNKFSWHDDVAQWFGLGSTYPSGRWMLEFMKIFEEFLFGTSLYSMPLYNGLVSILCIALVVILIIDLLDIKSDLACVGLSGIMVTFPVITGMFGYMFTAPAYMTGLLMGVFGAFLICKYRKWYTYIAALVLCSCCVATYQAFIPVMVSVFVIYMIKCNIENQEKSLADMIKEAVYYVVSCVAFMVIYLVVNKIVLNYYGAALLDYSGINNMGATSIKGYLLRILLAYKEFVLPDVTSTANMYPIGISRFYKVALVMIAVGTVYYLYKVFKKNIWSGLYVTALVCVLPLATNFVYFMCDLESVHSLTVYGKAFVLVYLIFLLDQLHIEELKWKQYAAKLGLAFMLVMAIMYVRFDNMCYLKAEIVQTQTIQYFSTMVTRIKSIEGYSDELPIAFVNQMQITDTSITQNPQFEAVNIIPYEKEADDLVNNYVWQFYLNNWLGYSPVIMPNGTMYGHGEVEQMLAYPDDGSIKIIDGMIVIKF